jgi:ankyrin repeat protein
MILMERFLLVKLRLDYILAKTSAKKRKQSLSSLPNTLEKAYADVMLMIEASGDDRKELAMRALSWVLHARRPLTMAELREAVAIEEDSTGLEEDDLSEATFIVECCGSLILHEQTGDIVRFAHFTVYDFIRTQSILLGEIYLAKSCLVYLSFDVFENAACQTQKDCRCLVKTYKLMLYSCKYWGTYVKGVAEDDVGVRKLLFRLLASVGKRECMLKMRFFTEWRLLYAAGQTSLHIIAGTGLASICRSFLTKGNTNEMLFLTNVNHGDESKDMDLLFGDERNVSAIDEAGRTALHCAAERGHNKVVITLLEGGADPSVQDVDGNTALHWAAERGYNKVVMALLEGGVDPSVQAENGYTALHWAAERGYDEVVMALLERGADSSVQDKDGYTALHHAAERGYNKVVMALLEGGVDPSVQAKNGYTALHWAAERGYNKVVMALLEGGADPSVQDKDGYTALHRAARMGDTNVLLPFLNRTAGQPTANRSITDAENDTANPSSTSPFEMTETRLDVHLWLASQCPNDHIFRIILAESLWDMGLHHQSVASYEVGIRLDPSNSSINRVEDVHSLPHYCSSCRKTIIGAWQKCTICPFRRNLCTTCYKRSNRFDRFDHDHAFLTIPAEGFMERDIPLDGSDLVSLKDIMRAHQKQ